MKANSMKIEQKFLPANFSNETQTSLLFAGVVNIVTVIMNGIFVYICQQIQSTLPGGYFG